MACSSPSRREILLAKHYSIVIDHNQQVEEEAKVLDNKKKAIRETAKAMTQQVSSLELLLPL